MTDTDGIVCWCYKKPQGNLHYPWAMMTPSPDLHCRICHVWVSEGEDSIAHYAMHGIGWCGTPGCWCDGKGDPIAVWENMRVYHDDDLVARCHRCRAQAAAAREWGFSGFDFAALPDYEAILEQIAAELIVEQEEADDEARGAQEETT